MEKKKRDTCSIWALLRRLRRSLRPVGEHPLVGADGEQGGVQVARQGSLAQSQFLHFGGDFLISFLWLGEKK